MTSCCVRSSTETPNPLHIFLEEIKGTLVETKAGKATSTLNSLNISVTKEEYGLLIFSEKNHYHGQVAEDMNENRGKCFLQAW